MNLQPFKNHTNKPKIFANSYMNYINQIEDRNNFRLNQSKFKIIEGWPFVYWISDGFRKKFKGECLEDELRVCTGLSTAHNNRFVRFWWEIEKFSINKKWKLFAKGGPYNKWWGNNWLTVNWDNNGYEIRQFESVGKAIRNELYYFKHGITNSLISVKGISNRMLPEGMIFDITAPSIFPKKYQNLLYVIGFLNSKLVQYIADCLNPTAALTWGDLQKIPFIIPNKQYEHRVSSLSLLCVDIKKHLCSYHIIETNFRNNPLSAFSEPILQDRILAYLNHENTQLTLVLLNEAIINQLIFEVYDLSPEDRLQVEIKMGKPVGELPVLAEARDAYLSATIIENEMVKEFIQNLTATEFEKQHIQAIKADFATLYKSNNNLEEFCISHQLNPINVWYWFKENKIIPKQRMNDIAMEFLADLIREILMEDEDGIAPLVRSAGEEILIERIEKKFFEKGFSSAQFSSFDKILGCEVNEYLNNRFFKVISNYLKLFKRLPSTPFIWHITSGPNHGFDAYIIIYKWNRDRLYLLKSVHIEKRETALKNRQSDLQNDNSAKAQNEKDLISKQLKEIENLKTKIDELLADGYNPVLDDGVGKNIAPLQKKGIIAYEVLNKGQLEKYLNADW